VTAASDKVLERLGRLHPKIIDLSLGRMQRLMAALGHPERQLPPVIHVAGTNGKGSTTAFLRAILEECGLRVHVYTSPHLVRFAERVRLAGKLIEEDHLLDILLQCEKANGPEPITYFEITTAAAFLAFHETPADIVLLEVGLGGRLDATNIIDQPLSTVITPVSMDHEAFLGNDIAHIAHEKAGIAKANTPLIIGPQDNAARLAILTQAEKVSARPYQAKLDWFYHRDRADSPTGYADHFSYGDAYGMMELPCPALPGEHQIINAATAIASLRHQNHFNITQSAYADGMLNAQWPARLQNITAGRLGQQLPQGSELWLDGGHNPAAGQAIAMALNTPGQEPLYLICGMMANKDCGGFLKPLQSFSKKLFAINIDGEDSHPAARIMAMAEEVGIMSTTTTSVEQAINTIYQQESPSRPVRILICGSLYLAGQVLRESNLPPT